MLIWLLFIVTTLLAQNVSSNCITKRNIEEGCVIQPVCYPPPMPIPYSDMEIPLTVDMNLDYPLTYCPEPCYCPMPYPEIPVLPCVCAPVWPDYGMPAPVVGGVSDVAVVAAVVEEPEIVECPVTTDIPLIAAVGFGSDAVTMALSPLKETADADVALLMFTKVKVI